MARFEVIIERECAELLLSYGFDKLLGFFVMVECGGSQKADYDALGDSYSGLPGLLEALIESGVFRREQIEEALECLMTMDSCGINDPDVRQAAVMVERLKEAAGD